MSNDTLPYVKRHTYLCQTTQGKKLCTTGTYVKRHGWKLDTCHALARLEEFNLGSYMRAFVRNGPLTVVRRPENDVAVVVAKVAPGDRHVHLTYAEALRACFCPWIQKTF